MNITKNENNSKKYFWFKLKTDFFTNSKTLLLETEADFLLYQLLYVKLCILAINWNGALLFSNDKPLDINKISSLTKIDKSIVENGIKLFLELDILYKDDDIYYLTDFQSMIGSSSTEYERTKKYKKNKSENTCDDNNIDNSNYDINKDVFVNDDLYNKVMNKIKAS